MHRKFIGILTILAAFIFLAPGTVKAQLPDYHIQLFDYSYGIRPGNIIAVARDLKGFIWILYPRSVQRFDGRRVQSFRLTGAMQSVFCDAKGRVWISSASKVYRFDERKQDFFETQVENSGVKSSFGPIFKMGEDKTWLLTTSSFYEYDEVSNRFIPVLQSLKIFSPFNVALFAQNEDYLFFGNSRKVYRYQVKKQEIDSLPNLRLRRLFSIDQDRILGNSWDIHSYWLNFQAGITAEAAPPAELRNMNNIKGFSLRGAIKIGPARYFFQSMEGLYEFNSESDKYRPVKLYYKGNPVQTADFANFIMLDSDDYVWMATIDGIARFPLHGQSFGLIKVRRSSSTLPAGIDNIRNIAEDDEDNIWLATGNGFVRWNRNLDTWKYYIPQEGSKTSLAFPSVRGLVYDGRNIILGPTDLGLWIFNPHTEKYKRPVYASELVKQRSERDFVDAIKTLNNGDQLIMGRDAIYILRNNTYKLEFLECPASSENSNFAYQGRDGIIWIATSRGLHILDSNLNYLQAVALPSENKFISAGYVLPDDRFLFALDKGLFVAKYTGTQVMVEKYTDAFDQVFVTSLYQDNHGFLWASSENGIYRYSTSDKKLSLYDYTDNIQGYGFNSNSWYRTRDGYLFLGGINGLNYIRPESTPGPDQQLKVLIYEVRSGGGDSTRYALSEKIGLPYTKRSLEIEFAAPYFSNPEKIQYRYKLEGLDKGWNYSGRSSVRFSSLPPGNYTLKLEASINSVDWVQSLNGVRFEISPPIWLTWWFILLAGLFFIFCLYLFVRGRNKKLREKQEALEAEQAINFFNSRIAESSSEDQLINEVANACIRRLGFNYCIVYLFNQTGQQLETKAEEKNQDEPFYSPDKFESGDGISVRVAKTGRAEIINGPSGVNSKQGQPGYFYAELFVPLINEGRILGVIRCARSKKRPNTQSDLPVLTSIASICTNKMVKIRMEAEKKLAEELLVSTQRRMDEIEMQALKAQMNPHFIFNSLNSINRYIIRNDQAKASLYLTRFARLIRLILDNSNNRTVTLEKELEALDLYIQMESIRFEKQFTWTLQVGEEVRTDSIYLPPLIIQPYVENAIWHGLLHKEEEGHLLIRIQRKSPGILECMIEDNGIGRQKAAELKSKSASTRKSMGMKLTEDRLALLNKDARADATIEIMDLKTSVGEAAGTRVILMIPIDE